jgi:hypothetical protein
MPGKKGMKQRPDTDSLRQKMWNSMRIHHKGFTIQNLLISTPGATYVNARKFLAGLTIHGVTAKCTGFVSGRPGGRQKWQLIDGMRHIYPGTCDRCGESFSAKVCDPEAKKKNKETERERKAEGNDHDRPDAAIA